jgi:hypothetical protein
MAEKQKRPPTEGGGLTVDLVSTVPEIIGYSTRNGEFQNSGEVLEENPLKRCLKGCSQV